MNRPCRLGLSQFKSCVSRKVKAKWGSVWREDLARVQNLGGSPGSYKFVIS